MRGILVKVDADAVNRFGSVEVPSGDECLRAMYRLLECSTVDVVRLADDVDMWLDDEGMYGGLVNPAATIIAGEFGFTWQPYFGHVLFLGGAGPRGDTVGLKAPRERELLQTLRGLAMTRSVE
jgi:Domain of unknown function (DUF3846)